VEETTENCLNKTKPVARGSQSTIANLSRLASILARTSVRSTPTSNQNSSKDLNSSSESFSPSPPTSCVQEFTTLNPQAMHALKSPRFTTCVQMPSSSKDISQVFSRSGKEVTQNASVVSPPGKEITQNSSVSSPPGSVIEALSSTNSKLQRLKILAGVMKNSEK
jgi:hypothetical protein